jgi:hypothetical protein
MKNQKESRLAWKIWNFLDEFNSLLWNLYEEEFLKFCQEDYIPDCIDNNENMDKWIFGTESDFAAAQNKKET